MYEALDQRLTEAQTLALAALVRTHDLTPGPGGARMLPLDPGLLQALLDLPPLHAAWLIALGPTQQIPAHTDPPLPGPRLHIPLETSPDCWTFSAGQWQQLDVGRMYRMDPTVVHGAVNWGPTRRVHLMLDLL